MSLNGVIDAFKTGTYSVSRATAGSYVAGRWVPGTPTFTIVGAVVQPLSGRELKPLPEGFHAENTRKLYSKSELFAATEGDTGKEADRITIGAEQWDVFSVAHWQRSLSGGDFYKAIVKKVIG